jgi:hypothetical protein
MVSKAHHPASFPTLVICVFATVVMLGGVGYALRPAPRPQPQPNSGLVVSEEHLHFGDVWLDKDFRWRLPITNTTAHAVHIVTFGTSCSCTAVRPASLEIPPGETVAVELQIDLTPPAPPETSSWNVSFRVVPQIEDGTGPSREWLLGGRVRAPFTVVQRLDFVGQDSLVLGEPVKPRTALLRSAIPLTDLGIECIPPVASVAIEKHDPQHFQLTITPRSDLPVGRQRVSLKCRFVPQEGAPVSCTPLESIVAVVNTVRVLPEAAVFGAVATGDEAAADLVLSSKTGKPFIIQNVDTDSKNVQVTPKDRPSQVSAIYSLKVRVREQGSQAAAVRFLIRTEDRQVEEVRVPISWHGLGPAN